MLWAILALPGPFVEKVLHALSPTLVSVGSQTLVEIYIPQHRQYVGTQKEILQLLETLPLSVDIPLMSDRVLPALERSPSG